MEKLLTLGVNSPLIGTKFEVPMILKWKVMLMLKAAQRILNTHAQVLYSNGTISSFREKQNINW